MIRLKNIDLSFSGKEIFKAFNLEITKGKHTCFSAPSGKGKTTILHLIQGYVRPQAGTVEIDGTILNEQTIEQLRNKMVIVPQNIHLPVKSGNELIRLLECEKQQSLIQDYVRSLGLEKELLSRHFDQISGGQKQRIIIAICLGLEKEIVLMDEPTASLDESSINLLIKTIKQLQGKTIVSASHNSSWANAADQIVHL